MDPKVCLELMEHDIEGGRRSAKSHDWYDALNNLSQAAQIAAHSYPMPQTYPNAVDNAITRLLGAIGTEITVAVSGDTGKHYMAFELRDSPGKTKVWQVVSTNHGFPLGEIRWYGGWRQYVFYPAADTLFNPDCMRQIAAFIENEMEARKRREAADIG